MKKNKPGILFGLLLLLMCGVLVLFLTVSEEYYDYASNAIEGAASVATLDKQDLAKLTEPVQEKLNTEVKFRNFFLTYPGAQKVELQADFNGWGKVPLELKAYSRGYFEISVALTAGEYKYVFVVDGQDVLDPNNLDRREYQGRTVCIKTVR